MSEQKKPNSYNRILSDPSVIGIEQLEQEQPNPQRPRDTDITRLAQAGIARVQRRMAENYHVNEEDDGPHYLGNDFSDDEEPGPRP